MPVYWNQALLCAPALPLILLTGLAVNRLVPAVVASGAALSTGFGASRTLLGQRWGAMIAATLGMAASSFAGSLLGGHAALHLVASGSRQLHRLQLRDHADGGVASRSRTGCSAGKRAAPYRRRRGRRARCAWLCSIYSVFGVTNRFDGREAASQIASASTKSLWLLLTKGRANRCGVSGIDAACEPCTEHRRRLP